ncbi:RNA polymerase sigma factor [Pedobacter sp. ok626]|uniref:RNA polymerase sigma factor n=1 Tax=Pedobacter sp. ok626 TaxID=1761882 RepID=UPI00352B87C9
MTQKFPQRGQHIVLMRLEKEYKFSEIAAILNISENNAKVQMSRAVRFMRKEFLKYKGFNRKL